MACIEIKSFSGELQVIPENTAYPPGWKFTGKVSFGCTGDLQLAGPSVDDELEKHGIKLGDAIAWVTKRIGIKQCAPCKARQEILNSASELGWSETLRQIRGTFS